MPGDERDTTASDVPSNSCGSAYAVCDGRVESVRLVLTNVYAYEVRNFQGYPLTVTLSKESAREWHRENVDRFSPNIFERHGSIAILMADGTWKVCVGSVYDLEEDGKPPPLNR